MSTYRLFLPYFYVVPSLLCFVFTATLSSTWPCAFVFGLNFTETWCNCGAAFRLTILSPFEYPWLVGWLKLKKGKFKSPHFEIFRSRLSLLIGKRDCRKEKECFECLFNINDMFLRFVRGELPQGKNISFLFASCQHLTPWWYLKRDFSTSKCKKSRTWHQFMIRIAQFIIHKRNMKIAKMQSTREKYSNYLILLHGQSMKDLFRFKRFHFNFIILFFFGA